jgi:hypothetical protein
MTTEGVGRGPLTVDGLCLFHSDLLPADCTLVGRQGCVGCLLSVRNLDAGVVLPGNTGATTLPRPIWEVYER